MLSTISSLVAVASDSLQQLVSQSSTRATSNPSSLKRYTLDDVAQHCFHDDCWLVVHNRVYDVTSFITQHPGGEEIIWEHAGRDATLAFTGAGHSQDAVVILNKYIIGVLVEEEHVNIISDMGFQMAVCTES
uniref:Putative cytochrome b5 n=2 Tax=Ornithodoros turicata TaxID=34597 RepID=A0A2R5LFN9_9ACAR